MIQIIESNFNIKNKCWRILNAADLQTINQICFKYKAAAGWDVNNTVLVSGPVPREDIHSLVKDLLAKGYICKGSYQDQPHWRYMMLSEKNSLQYKYHKAILKMEYKESRIRSKQFRKEFMAFMKTYQQKQILMTATSSTTTTIK